MSITQKELMVVLSAKDNASAAIENMNHKLQLSRRELNMLMRDIRNVGMGMTVAGGTILGASMAIKTGMAEWGKVNKQVYDSLVNVTQAMGQMMTISGSALVTITSLEKAFHGLQRALSILGATGGAAALTAFLGGVAGTAGLIGAGLAGLGMVGFGIHQLITKPWETEWAAQQAALRESQRETYILNQLRAEGMKFVQGETNAYNELLVAYASQGSKTALKVQEEVNEYQRERLELTKAQNEALEEQMNLLRQVANEYKATYYGAIFALQNAALPTLESTGVPFWKPYEESRPLGPEAGINTNQGVPLEINVNIDGQTAAKALIGPLGDQLRQRSEMEGY